LKRADKTIDEIGILLLELANLFNKTDCRITNTEELEEFRQGNPSKAFSWFWRAALHGHPDSAYRCGCYYACGKVVQPDVTSAARLLKFAADSGHVSAMFAYATLLEHRVHPPNHLDIAAEYYRRYAILDSGRGMTEWGHFRKRMPARKSTKVSVVPPSVIAPSSQTGLTALQHSWCEGLHGRHADVQHARHDDIQATYRKARSFEKGMDVPFSPTVAAEFYLELANKKFVKGLYRYGRCLLEGKGVEQSPSAAFTYFLGAASEGHSRALYFLCCLHLDPLSPLDIIEQCLTLRVCPMFKTIPRGYPHSSLRFPEKFDPQGSELKLSRDLTLWFGPTIWRFNTWDDQIFLRQLPKLRELRHPCVLSIREVVHGKPSTQDLVKCSLSDVFKRELAGDPPSFWSATQKSIAICELVFGMIYIHANGLVHSDLHPGIIHFDHDNHLQIGGLNCCCSAAEGLRDERRCDFQYAPPEYYLNQPCAMSGDVFSFGLILFEICTGRAAFPRWSGMEKIKFDAVKGIRPQIPECVPPQLQSLICRCWTVQPDERPTFVRIFSELWQMHLDLLPGNDAREVQVRVCQSCLPTLVELTDPWEGE
jgi:serine/threonine protein kinase